MKKIILFFCLFFLSFPVYAIPSISSTNVYFYEIDREEVLYEKGAKEKISIASLTKLMTALVALDEIKDLDAKVTLTANDFKGLVEAHASQAGFRIGEVVTYRDLLYGLLLPSGAECALALSNHLVGSEKAMVQKMNEKASTLGLQNTHFVNTTGLDEEGHYSTLEEVAIILREGLKNPDFEKIFSSRKYTTSNKNHTFESTLEKNSRIAKIDTSYIQGSKTGYTYDAGLCLASVASHEGEQYLLITAGADYKSGKPNQVIDSDKLYQYFFTNYEYKTILKKGDILKEIPDENGKIHTYQSDTEIIKYLPKSTEISYEYEGAEKLLYTMKAGDKIGEYRISIGEEVLFEEPFYLEYRILKPLPEQQILLGIVLILLGIFFLTVFFIHRKRKKRKRKRTQK